MDPSSASIAFRVLESKCSEFTRVASFCNLLNVQGTSPRGKEGGGSVSSGAWVNIFAVQGYKQLGLFFISFFLSVCLSVCPSVRPSFLSFFLSFVLCPPTAEKLWGLSPDRLWGGLGGSEVRFCVGSWDARGGSQQGS